MFKSALLVFAFVPQIQSYMLPSITKNPMKSVLSMQAGNKNEFGEPGWGLPQDDAQTSVLKMEMLLNEEDFSQDYIKEIVNTASYSLLPDLKENLANNRIEQIARMHAGIRTHDELNYVASYFATYVAVRFYDEVAAPLAAFLLLQPRLIPSLKFKCDQGMIIPNIAEMILPGFIKDSLWFESLKTSEFPLGLEENLQDMLLASKRQIPIGIAHNLLESYKKFTTGLTNLYIFEDEMLDDRYNKAQWVLAQSLVLYQLNYDNNGFVGLWTELYELFKGNERSLDEVRAFHDYLMSWIGISYHGEEQVFQRFHEEVSGYRRRHDFYANSFCKVLKWHRSLDVEDEN